MPDFDSMKEGRRAARHDALFGDLTECLFPVGTFVHERCTEGYRDEQERIRLYGLDEVEICGDV
ncbi:MAG: hypothetical protein E5Y31_20965 [Mesorhizobium sp.]|nr:MAG: hypothetical protein E5Y31_20965 [Mesorhizobium sp.]